MCERRPSSSFERPGCWLAGRPRRCRRARAGRLRPGRRGRRGTSRPPPGRRRFALRIKDQWKIDGAGAGSKPRRRRSRPGRRPAPGWARPRRCRPPRSRGRGRCRMSAPAPRSPEPVACGAPSSGEVAIWASSCPSGPYRSATVSLGSSANSASGALLAGRARALTGRREVLGILVHRRRTGYRGRRWRRDYGHDDRQPRLGDTRDAQIEPCYVPRRANDSNVSGYGSCSLAWRWDVAPSDAAAVDRRRRRRGLCRPVACGRWVLPRAHRWGHRRSLVGGGDRNGAGRLAAGTRSRLGAGRGRLPRRPLPSGRRSRSVGPATTAAPSWRSSGCSDTWACSCWW